MRARHRPDGAAHSVPALASQRQLLPSITTSISGMRATVQDHLAIINGAAYQARACRLTTCTRAVCLMTHNGCSYHHGHHHGHHQGHHHAAITMDSALLSGTCSDSGMRESNCSPCTCWYPQPTRMGHLCTILHLEVVLCLELQGERTTVRMTLNGYNWARLARVRLLHSFLCAFTGVTFGRVRSRRAFTRKCALTCILTLRLTCILTLRRAYEAHTNTRAHTFLAQ